MSEFGPKPEQPDQEGQLSKEVARENNIEATKAKPSFVRSMLNRLTSLRRSSEQKTKEDLVEVRAKLDEVAESKVEKEKITSFDQVNSFKDLLGLDELVEVKGDREDDTVNRVKQFLVKQKLGLGGRFPPTFHDGAMIDKANKLIKDQQFGEKMDWDLQKELSRERPQEATINYEDAKDFGDLYIALNNNRDSNMNLGEHDLKVSKIIEVIEKVRQDKTDRKGRDYLLHITRQDGLRGAVDRLKKINKDADLL